MKRVLTARFMHETNTFSRVHDRHGDDPPPRLPPRKRDPRGVPRHPLGLRRDLRGGRQIRLDAWSTRSPPTPTRPASSPTRRSRQIAGMILDAVDDEGPDRRRAAASARRDGQREPRGCRGRVSGAAAPRARTRGAGRRHPRPARQCDAAHGRQRERADRLPHLPAYRPVRARLAGRRAAGAGDAGRDPAEDRDRPPADDLRPRPRPHPARADGRADRPRRGARSSAARRWRSASAPGSAAPISTMSARR